MLQAGCQDDVGRLPTRSGTERLTASVPLGVKRPETSRRVQSRDTVRAATTRSSAVEWTRNAGACVTPFILQLGSSRVLLSSFRRWEWVHQGWDA